MSATTITMVKGDTEPVIQGTLQYDDGSAVNLTGCTVLFVLSQNGASVLSKAASIVNAANGTVLYSWQSNDTASLLGIYNAEFQVTYLDGTVQSFPTAQNFYIQFFS